MLSMGEERNRDRRGTKAVLYSLEIRDLGLYSVEIRRLDMYGVEIRGLDPHSLGIVRARHVHSSVYELKIMRARHAYPSGYELNRYGLKK